MCLLDERILELVEEFEPASTDLICRELQLTVSTKQVQERCMILADAGLLEPFFDSKDADLWEVSIWGKLYLAGQIDANLRRPLPGPRPPHAVRPRYWV